MTILLYDAVSSVQHSVMSVKYNSTYKIGFNQICGKYAYDSASSNGLRGDAQDVLGGWVDIAMLLSGKSRLQSQVCCLKYLVRNGQYIEHMHICFGWHSCEFSFRLI